MDGQVQGVSRPHTNMRFFILVAWKSCQKCYSSDCSIRDLNHNQRERWLVLLCVYSFFFFFFFAYRLTLLVKKPNQIWSTALTWHQIMSEPAEKFSFNISVVCRDIHWRRFMWWLCFCLMTTSISWPFQSIFVLWMPSCNTFISVIFCRARPTFCMSSKPEPFERILSCRAYSSRWDTRDNDPVKTWRWPAVRALCGRGLLQFSGIITLFKSTHLLNSLQPLKGSQRSRITNEHIITFRQAKWRKEEGKWTFKCPGGEFSPTYCQLFNCRNLFIKSRSRMES